MSEQSRDPATPVAAREKTVTTEADEDRDIDRLFFYVRKGEAHWVRFYAERGTDFNRQDESGMTVLHHAVAAGARPCIRALVSSGRCDYLIRDNLGRYASDIAIEWSRDFAVARLLSKHQAKQALARGILPFQTDQR